MDASSKVSARTQAGGPPEFEAWLREQCFQMPTMEAYDLARGAWEAAAVHVAKRCALTARNLYVQVGTGPAVAAGGEWIADEIERVFVRAKSDLPQP